MNSFNFIIYFQVCYMGIVLFGPAIALEAGTQKTLNMLLVVLNL